MKLNNPLTNPTLKLTNMRQEIEIKNSGLLFIAFLLASIGMTMVYISQTLLDILEVLKTLTP